MPQIERVVAMRDLEGQIKEQTDRIMEAMTGLKRVQSRMDTRDAHLFEIEQSMLNDSRVNTSSTSNLRNIE